MIKKIVMLSGGLDSYTCLLGELKTCRKEELCCLLVDYGQTHKIELSYAKTQAESLGIKIHEASIGYPGSFRGGLFDESVVGYDVGVSAYFVPFRNTLLIALGASLCQQYECRTLVVGFNKDDQELFPDCQPKFVNTMERLLELGGYRVCVETPLMDKTKQDIVKMLGELGGVIESTYSCYLGGDIQCGVCPACKGRT